MNRVAVNARHAIFVVDKEFNAADESVVVSAKNLSHQ